MKAFAYSRASDLAGAVRAGARPGSRFLAGGTTQLDLMKCGVERPAQLIDLTRLPGLDHVEVSATMIRIGALAKMAHVADDTQLRQAAPVLSEALWKAASAQLRNMASIGGNLMQRTRCGYFRDPAAYPNCNKRRPGSGCAAMDGVNKAHAVLGGSDACIAVYPGDLAVALTAFDAVVRVHGAAGERSVPIDAFYRLPGDCPDLEHDLAPGEVIIGVDIPVTPVLKRSHYLKVRDRASYEFAAASAAVGLELAPDNRTIRAARVALGGVASKPWRARTVETALVGRTLDEATLRQAAALAVEGAQARAHNGYKITLAPRVVARALMIAGGLA
jgi:xanthine dehydrogenase YagS FAD-binding subunit